MQAGQVLFTLDYRPLEAALHQAEANLERDTAQAANAKVIAQRMEDLVERGVGTREQRDTARTTAAALDAVVGANRAAVENAKVQLQYATIRAPISGRTGALMVNAGNLVRANDQTPLVVINQVSPIYVSFGIPETLLPDLRRYMAERTLEVEATPPNEAVPPAVGRITFVDNAVDQTTGTIRIKATFPNENRRLWPGQFVNVSVRLATGRERDRRAGRGGAGRPRGSIRLRRQERSNRRDETGHRCAHGRKRNDSQERREARGNGRHRRPAAPGAR